MLGKRVLHLAESSYSSSSSSSSAVDEMEVRCRECRKWEQHYYWNHFEATKKRFFKVLIADFSRELSIPRKFVLHFRDLPEDAKLKGPSGNLWSVRLRRSGDDIAFTGGWSKFAEDHQLELGDFLVFRYIGDSCFKVLIFGKNACEKEHSYFIGEKPTAEVGTACPSSRRCKHKSVEPPVEDDEKSACAGKQCSFSRRTAASPAAYDEVRHEHEKGTVEDKMTKVRSCSSSTNPNPTRRPAAVEEKQTALSLARSMRTTHPSFIAELKQSNVSQGYVLVIPRGFAVENMPGCDQSVLLRLPGGGKTWEVNYIVHYKATKLGSGWRNFVVDNYLEKDDVCVFEIISAEKNHDFVLEVSIFRAVSPVIVPPAELSTEGLGGETK